ncbi:hypothetical protein V6N11_083005 [Hibiscus sabdariffa]|uniref:Uncharacterized protein n=1 Tax=Hibiscus sabdariffa TaxID=183260 RepID=A0ABR2QKK3_9ROSI
MKEQTLDLVEECAVGDNLIVTIQAKGLVLQLVYYFAMRYQAKELNEEMLMQHVTILEENVMTQWVYIE